MQLKHLRKRNIHTGHRDDLVLAIFPKHLWIDLDPQPYAERDAASLSDGLPSFVDTREAALSISFLAGRMLMCKRRMHAKRTSRCAIRKIHPAIGETQRRMSKLSFSQEQIFGERSSFWNNEDEAALPRQLGVFITTEVAVTGMSGRHAWGETAVALRSALDGPGDPQCQCCDGRLTHFPRLLVCANSRLFFARLGAYRREAQNEEATCIRNI